METGDRESGWQLAVNGAGRSCTSGRANRPECVSCKPYEQVVVRSRAEPFAVSGDQRLSQAQRSSPASAASASADCGFARPSCRTATASHPHISLAPLMPKCRHRLVVSSLGSPVVRAVPAFHRQDAEAIADPSAVDLDRARQAASPRVRPARRRTPAGFRSWSGGRGMRRRS